MERSFPYYSTIREVEIMAPIQIFKVHRASPKHSAGGIWSIVEGFWGASDGTGYPEYRRRITSVSWG